MTETQQLIFLVWDGDNHDYKHLKVKTMKKLITRSTALLFLFAVVACSEDALVENIPTNDDTIKEICITGKDFQFDSETRSSVTISESGASFTWDEDDVIGIFPNTGDQVSFAMDEGAGTQTATFSGGGWALKSSATYAAYYPHVYENRDMTQIPVSYVGQTQNGNNNTDHIGAYDFMAAGVSTPSNGKVAFAMQHLGCLVQLKIKMPQPTTLEKIKLISATALFTEKGTIDLTAKNVEINGNRLSGGIEIDLQNIQTTTANEEVTIYFMMAPVNLKDKELFAEVTLQTGASFHIDIVGKNFEAGKVYALTGSIIDKEKDVIIYTSVETGSLEYELVRKHGNPYEITSLKVVGDINGTDIRYLRKMAGRAQDATATEGKLKYLDLTEANIVAGGDYYIKYNSTEYKTENNVAGDYMFFQCNLETLKFPLSVTTLGRDICSHLYISDNHKGTFTSITIPNGVLKIGNQAFAYNQDLASIEIPNSVKEIGWNVFYRCDALASVIIPNSVEKMSSAFYYSLGLQTVHLPENSNYTTIESQTFEGCSSLESLTISANIKNIQSAAFKNSNLKELHMESTTPPSMDSEAGLPTSCKVYVPSGCYNAYKKTGSSFSKFTIIEE